MNKYRIYLPAVPNLSSANAALQKEILLARLHLIELLHAKGFHVEHSLGQETWVKNLGARTDAVDGVLFPPMSGLLTGTDATQIKAQRFFEAVSVLTSMHVGDHRIYGHTGISKPCGFIDPDGSWQSLIALLSDLHDKGAFSTKIADIAFCIQPQGDEALAVLNQRAVAELQKRFLENAGKLKNAVHAVYPESHQFNSFRKDSPRSDFGVIAFGSATMRDEIYMKAGYDFCCEVGKKGMRLITGAGKESLMGAFDAGFHEGAEIFNALYPEAAQKPAHVGISTNDVLRLEGPPEHLDQLIVVPTRNERLIAFIKGRGHSDESERCAPTAKVACVFPGGIGSLEEFATMIQLKLHGNMMDGVEIHLCNINGYYDKLIEICETLGVRHLFKVFPDEKTMMARVNEIHAEWLIKNPQIAGGGCLK